MSYVTDVILVVANAEGHTSHCDEDADPPGVAGVNAWLASERHRGLGEVDYGRAGGNKYHQCRIYTGAFNYLNIGDFLAAVAARRWDYRDMLQVFVKDEHDDAFTPYHLPGARVCVPRTIEPDPEGVRPC